MTRKLAPVHPGEILREGFLTPLRLTSYGVAKALGVPRTRIERLAREETPVTADTALRLARYFGTTAAFWINLQGQYDLERTTDAVSREIARIKPVGLRA
jgi:addiction module HigA family antidote